MFQLKCQIYQTHHYALYPQCVHCPLIHLYTCVHAHAIYHGTKYCVKCFAYINYFNPHKGSVKKVVIPILMMGKPKQRLSHLFKVT